MLKAYSLICALGSFLINLGDHTWCWWLNTYWPHAEQEPVPSLQLQEISLLIIKRIWNINLKRYALLWSSQHCLQQSTYKSTLNDQQKNIKAINTREYYARQVWCGQPIGTKRIMLHEISQKAKFWMISLTCKYKNKTIGQKIKNKKQIMDSESKTEVISGRKDMSPTALWHLSLEKGWTRITKS